MQHKINILARGDSISPVTNEYALDHAVFSVISSHKDQQAVAQGIYRVPPVSIATYIPNFENLQSTVVRYLWVTETQTMWLWCQEDQKQDTEEEGAQGEQGIEGEGAQGHWVECTDCPRAQPAANIDQDQLVALIEASPEYQQLIQENAEKLDIQP